MILPIVKIGHPTLRAKAKLITEINDEIKEVIDNMIETMDSFKGIGLAAPQIGISLSLIIADLTILEGEGQIIIINPKIIEVGLPPITVINFKAILLCNPHLSIAIAIINPPTKRKIIELI